MTDIQRRAGDGPEFDPRKERYWHGAPRPEEFVNGSEVKAGWGDKALTLRGPLTIIVVLLALLGVIVMYVHDVQRREHTRLMSATNVAICVSLYDFQERKTLREAWRQDKGALRWWCPNVNE